MISLQSTDEYPRSLFWAEGKQFSPPSFTWLISAGERATEYRPEFSDQLASNKSRPVKRRPISDQFSLEIFLLATLCDIARRSQAWAETESQFVWLNGGHAKTSRYNISVAAEKIRPNIRLR